MSNAGLRDRPVPEFTKDSEEFWRMTGVGRLMLRKCNDCAHVFFYPRLFCNKCLSAELCWQNAAGVGTVYSFSVIYRAPNPQFQALVPYVVALVELAEGPRIMSNVIRVSPDHVHIGLAVHLEFVAIADGIALPYFRPTRQELPC